MLAAYLLLALAAPVLYGWYLAKPYPWIDKLAYRP